MATIESNNGLAIIKDYDLKNHFSSLKVGDIVDDLFVRTFSGLFTVNAEDIIEQQKISGWRIETQPGFNSETLGQIKQPLRITPVHNLSPEAHKKSLIAANRAATTSTAVSVITHTLKKAANEIQSSYTEQRDLFEKMFENYDAFKKEEVYGFDHFKIDASKPSTIEEIDMLLKFMSRRYYDYSEKELGLLANYKINIPLNTGTPYEVPVLDTKKESIYNTIAKSHPRTVLSELLTKQDPITGKISDPFFAYGAVYESDEYVEYLERAGVKGLVAEGDAFSKFAYIPEDLYYDFDGERIEQLKLFIDDVARDHGYNRKEVYGDEVYKAVADQLQEFDAGMYDYFMDFATPTDLEKEKINASLEEKGLLLTSKEIERERALLEQSLAKDNLASQIDMFYANFDFLRADDRTYLNGRDTSNVNPDIYPDMTEDEKFARYTQDSALTRSMNETDSYLEKVKKSTHELINGVWTPIPEKMPRRPTDHLRMTVIGDLYGGQEMTLEESFKANGTHDISTEIDRLRKESLVVQRMIEKPYDPDKPRDVFKAELQSVMDKLIGVGRQTVEQAKEEKAAALAEIKSLQEQQALRVFEMHGISRDAAQKIREEFHSATSYADKINIASNFFNTEIYSGITDEVDDAFVARLDEFKNAMDYEVDQSTFFMSHNAPEKTMERRFKRMDKIFKSFENFASEIVSVEEHPALEKFHSDLAKQIHIVDIANSTIESHGVGKAISEFRLETKNELPLGISKQDYIEYYNDPNSIDGLVNKLQSYTISQGEKTVLEDRLTYINQQIEELTNKSSKFQLNTSNQSFGEALAHSFRKMIDEGSKNFFSARSTYGDAFDTVTNYIMGHERILADEKLRLDTVSEIESSKQSLSNMFVSEEYDGGKLKRELHYWFNMASRLDDNVDPKEIFSEMGYLDSDAPVERAFLHRNKELEELWNKSVEAIDVIKHKGYSPSEMGRTIVDGDILIQVGMSEEQYNKYRDRPRSVTELAASVQKHKVIAEKKRKMSNVASWLDAARSGSIVRSSEGDSIGYKVIASSEGDIATLSRPAVKVSEVKFGDFNITNKQLLESLQDGTLEHSSLERAFDFVINPDLPKDIAYGGNDYITLNIDEHIDGLYKRKTMSKTKVNDVKSEIMHILQGKELPKDGYGKVIQYQHLLDGAQTEAMSLKDEWLAGESIKAGMLNQQKQMVSNIEQQLRVAQYQYSDANRVHNMLKIQSETLQSDIQTASKRKAKQMQAELDSILTEIEEIGKEKRRLNREVVHQQRALQAEKKHYREYYKLISTGVVADEPVSPGYTTIKETIERQKAIQEQVFNKHVEVFEKNETNRFVEMSDILKSMGIDPDEYANATEFKAIKLSKEDLINKFLIGDDRNSKNPYSYYFNQLVNSHLSHLRTGREANKELGAVASGMLQMFEDLINDNVEIDVSTKAFESRYMMELNSDAATRSDLTVEQLKRLNLQMDKLKDKTPIQRLQELLFSEVNRRAIAESHPTSGLGELDKYENTIRNIYDMLATKHERGNITGEFIRREMHNRDSGLNTFLTEGYNKNVLKLTADQIDQIIENSAQIRSSIDVPYEDWSLMEEKRLELDEDYNKRHINGITEELEELKVRASQLAEDPGGQQFVLDELLRVEDKKQHAMTEYAKLEKHNALRKEMTALLGLPIHRLLDENNNKKSLAVVQKIHNVLGEDYGYKKLIETDSDHLYTSVFKRMTSIKNSIERDLETDGISVKNNSKLDEFERLYKFAFASTLNKKEAFHKFMSMEDLVRLLPEKSLVKQILDKGDDRTLDQMVSLSEKHGTKLTATIPVPGTEHTTNAVIRRRKDGLIEAYSSELQQGFVVNDTGKGPTATVDMNTSRAYTRNNAIHSLDSMSASRPALRTTLSTYQDIKRKGVAVNPSNVTATVAESIQALKDGSTIMSYDIETTLTGAKQLKSAIQPVEIFARKFQLNEDGTIKRNENGVAYIDTHRLKEVEKNGATVLENTPQSIESKFHGVIALNKESLDLIEDYQQGRKDFTVRLDKFKTMHVADIIDSLEWKRNMTETQQSEFNVRKQEFFASLAKGKKLKTILKEVDEKLEAFHLVSNVAKYSMATANRGDAFLSPDGTIPIRRANDKGNPLSLFETYSKVQAVPTHNEIITQLMKNPQSGVDFDSALFNAIFTEEDGSLIRRSPHSRAEADYVLSVQKKYTANLLGAANEGATNLATGERAKQMFGDHVVHFDNESQALTAFQNYMETDDVKAIMGVNVEKADNETMAQRAVEHSPKKADGTPAKIVTKNEAIFTDGINKLRAERDKLLQGFLSGISEEYAEKFRVNPSTAQSFAKRAQEAENEGRNIAGYLNDKPNIWVSNASEAISYLPKLHANTMNVTPSSEQVMEMDNQLARLTHAIDTLKGRGKGARVADAEVYDEYNLFGGRKYSLRDRTVIEDSIGLKMTASFQDKAVIDQQVLSKLLYPSLQSHAAEEIMKHRNVGTEAAHAADFDVDQSIDVFEEFTTSANKAIHGKDSGFDGVNTVVKEMGITPETQNVYDELGYKEGQFVLLREQYDKDMHNGKNNAQGQVGVYRIDSIHDDMKGFSLVRQVMGAKDVSDDTSVEKLEFRGVTNADFDAKVAQKLEYLPNKEAVFGAIEGYNKDIAREHFDRMFRSGNSYYQHLNQAQQVASMFESNPLFNVGQKFDFATTPLTVPQLLEHSNERNGFIPVGKTPLARARMQYDAVNAIVNQGEFELRVSGSANAPFNFELGGEKIEIPHGTGDRINVAGKSVGFEIFGKPVVNPSTGEESNKMFIRLNPDKEWNEHTVTPEERAVIANKHLLTPDVNDEFYAPEISKEHLSALRDIKKFNDSDLGKSTRKYIDDVTTLQNLGVNSNGIDYDTAGRMIKQWNETIKDYARERGHTRTYNNLSTIENLQFDGKPDDNGVSKKISFDQVLDHTTPMRAVESLASASDKIMREGKLNFGGAENKQVAVTNNILVPQLVDGGFLPKGYGLEDGERKILSLETIGSDIVKHVQSKGSPNPLEVTDYLKVAQDFKNPQSELRQSLNLLRKQELQPRISNLSSGNKVAFKHSKALLQDVVDEGLYLGGMKVRTVDINIEGVKTLEEMSSPSFLARFSIDELVKLTDERAGSHDAVDMELSKLVYRELGQRAVARDPKNNKLDAKEIIASGDMERIKAAEALNMVQASNAKINGEIQYSPIEDITQHRLVYGSTAGAKIGDVSWKRLQKLADLADPENYAVHQQQARMIQKWGKEHSWKGHDLGERPYYSTVRGETPRDVEGHAEALRQRNAATKEQAETIDRALYEPATPDKQVSGFSSLDTTVNNVGANGQPLLNVSNPEESKDPLHRKIAPEDIAGPEEARSSEMERIIGNTKDEIRDKMKSFLHGESGGKWVAGLGVAAAALFAVNSVNGPLRLENRPNGHGVKGITGTPEDDKERGQQRETKSYQADTASKAYVNAGDKGYTIQARGRANSSLDAEQLHSSVNNGMGGAGSVNINIRDDRSTLDNKWLEDQFSNYINRGHVGEY